MDYKYKTQKELLKSSKSKGEKTEKKKLKLQYKK